MATDTNSPFSLGAQTPLKDQIQQQWGQYGDWNAAGQDQSQALAGLLESRGVTDLSQLQFRPRTITDPAYQQQITEDATTEIGPQQRQVYDAYYGDQPIGFAGDINADGSYGTGAQTVEGQDPAQLGVGGNMLAWSAQGGGNTSFKVIPGPDGSPIVAPVWASSSEDDINFAKTAAIMAAAAYGGAALGGGSTAASGGLEMTNGAFLGEGVSSGVGAWDAAAIKSAVASGELGTAASYAGQNLSNGTLTDTARSLYNPTTPTSTPTDAGNGGGGTDKSLIKLGTQLGGTVLSEQLTKPDTVDTNQAVKDQGQANLDAMHATNQGNRVNTTTPYGSQRFQPIPDPTAPGGIRWEQTITFSPEQQALYDSQTQGQIARSNMGNAMLPGLQAQLSQPLNLSSMDPNSLQRGATSNLRADFKGPTVDPLGQMQLMDLGASPQMGRMAAGQGPQARDLFGRTGYSGSVDTVRQSVIDQFDNLNGKAFSQQLADLDNRLKNMGLTEGTEAYDREMANLRQSQGQQRNDAVQRAVQAGGAEQSRLAGIDLAADDQRFQQQQTSQFLNPLATIQANNQAAQAEYQNLLAAYNQQNTTKDAAQKNAIAIAQAKNDAENMRLNFGLNQTGLNNSTLRADQQTALQLAQHNDQNAILERSVPLNNYTALMTGTQATLPQFQPFGMGSATGAPIMQGATLNQQQNIADANRTAGYVQQGLNIFGNWLGG